MSGILPGLLFLAGQTARSQAYAQCLRQAGLIPEHTLVFGAANAGLPGQFTGAAAAAAAASGEIFFPNLAEPLEQTLEKGNFPREKLAATDVNDPSVLASLVERKPRLVIYSGYGSQLVKKPLLELGVPFLHCHSGWVPDFKGSTTLYYSWLQENSAGVSAIVLNSQIDQGDIVARKRYPAPPEGVDPDYVYDTAIRGDLLVTTLKAWAQSGNLPRQPQTEEGNVYYVIHPVLKHLARMRKS